MIDIIRHHPHLPPSALAVVEAALAVPRDAIWCGCCHADVRRVTEALDARGMIPTPAVPRLWWHSCPSSETPQCNLYGLTKGPARPSCCYCHGRGFCTSEHPSRVADLVSVYAHGAERLALAEDIARRTAADCGVALAGIAWQIVSAYDMAWWPSYRALRRAWCAPLDIGPDGVVVLGVERVLVAERFDEAILTRLRAVAEVSLEACACDDTEPT
jgi:hypothetical protein